MQSLLEQLDQLDIHRKGNLIPVKNCTKDTIEQVISTLNHEFVTSISVTTNTIQFTLDPVIEAEWILRKSISRPESSLSIIAFQLPVPGQSLNGSFLRILFTAQYIVKSKQYLGHECKSIGIPHISTIETGYLLLSFEKFGNEAMLSKKDSCFYLTELVSESISKSLITKEEAQDAVDQLLQDLKRTELYARLYESWAQSMNVLLKTHGIQLSVPTAIQLDCSILKSNSDLFSKNGEPTNAAFVALNLPKERDITVVFDSRALWVYEKVQEHFKDNLMAQVPISICQGLLSSNRDLLDGLLCDAMDLIASESSSDPQSQVAQALGKSFFIIQLLSMRRSKKMQFSNFRLDNQEANLGVYIQYTYSRICGVERNIDEDCKQWDSLDPLTVTPKVFELIQQLDQFDHVLQKSINEPSIMVAYLLQLSKTISSQYYHLRVKGEPLERQKARWAVLSLCKKVLKSGLTLFGLEPVTEI